MSDIPIDTWHILVTDCFEIVAGKVRQREVDGSSVLHVEIPGLEGEAAEVQVYEPGAVVCMVPAAEAAARAVAACARVWEEVALTQQQRDEATDAPDWLDDDTAWCDDCDTGLPAGRTARIDDAVYCYACALERLQALEEESDGRSL